MSPKLSVIIPCYNMGDYVKDAINSVLSYPNQDDIEIIVVNDGSDDHNYTKSILDSYSNSNITVVHQDNKGLGPARNNGISLAKAPYVLMLDADNKIRLNFITKGIENLNKHSRVGVLYGNMQKFGDEETLFNPGPFDMVKMLKKNYIDACVILRKKAWESVGGYDEHMPIMGYEDWDFHIRLFFRGWDFYYLNDILFDYRIRSDSMLKIINRTTAKHEIIDYIFSKPGFEQIRALRNELLKADDLSREIENTKKRYIIKKALILEKIIKSNVVFKSLKNYKNNCCQ